VHYRAELETNSELDAITAQVVAQLREVQAAANRQSTSTLPPEQIEAKQAELLLQLCQRLLVPAPGVFLSKALKPIGRRLAKLFFASALHDKTQDGARDKTIHHAEQGVYYVLQRHERRIRAELEGFDYATAELRAASLELFAKVERELRQAFLSRRSPELNRVMTAMAAVLGDFFDHHLPPQLEPLVRATLRGANTARRPDSLPYKIQASAFGDFRQHWERRLVEQMVAFCSDELLARLQSTRDDYLKETLDFFSDPAIYAAAAEVVCEQLYDYLCLEGFLDAPLDWKARRDADS